MITYHDKCGSSAVLNSIVMAGAHDAGITKGGGNARTQKLNIRRQAVAGVRLFDLRIAAGRSHGRTVGTKNAELRTYHADGAAKVQETKTRYLTDIGQNVQIEQSKIRAGTFGETLSDILEQAKTFVSYNPTEFLILKFDKCLNWPQVAQACVQLLDQKIYKGGGNLNLKTLEELAGWVIVVFTEEGQRATATMGPAQGICGIKNCNGGGPYTHQYDGLQYYGKGGTALMGLSPISENRTKQAGLMRAGIQCDPDAMGMMYWTSTGLIGNIKKRNEKMWTRTNNASLQKTWRDGLGESITDRLNKSVRLESGGNVMKTFMPNIVMIDFADEHKCRTIMDLNDVSGHDLMKLVNGDTEAEAASSEG